MLTNELSSCRSKYQTYSCAGKITTLRPCTSFFFPAVRMSDFWDLKNYDTATMHFKFSSAGHVERREHVAHAQCASASARPS